MNTRTDTAADLEAQARPLPEGPSLDVTLGDIPLPPAALVDQLDNSGAGGAEEDAAPAEVATLDFCGDDLPFEHFPLKHPFRRDGVRTEAITVSQLTVEQMGAIVREAGKSGRAPELMEVYAVMTGHTAAVLRALPAVDGDPIIEKAFSFLPPLLRPESG